MHLEAHCVVEDLCVCVCVCFKTESASGTPAKTGHKYLNHALIVTLNCRIIRVKTVKEHWKQKYCIVHPSPSNCVCGVGGGGGGDSAR